MTRRTLPAAVVAALLAAPVVAAAQPQPADPEAEAAWRRGEALRAQGDHAEALEAFRELHGRTRQARALAQVALAEAALGRWVEAETHLIEALTARRDPWIASHRAELQASLTQMRAHVGTLVVDANDASAEVWVDGRRVGVVASPIHVLAGEVRYEVRAERRPGVAGVATVPADGVARVEVSMPPPVYAAPTGGGETPGSTAPTETAAPATPVTAAPAATGAAVDATRAPVATDRGGGGAGRALGWVGLGAGVALVAGGVAVWLVGRSATAAYNDDPSCPGVGAPLQPSACASRLGRAEALEPVAWVATAAGAALGLTGAVLLATTGGARAPRSARRGCAVSVGAQAGVVCAVEF